MAQRSQFWDTAGAVGDGNDTYSAAQWREMARDLWTPDKSASEGVLAGVLAELGVSGSNSPVTIAAGAALVSGVYYKNDSGLAISVPTPIASTAKHRVILRANWGSVATVRAALVLGQEGTGSYPALTQQDNSTWEIPLAGVMIDTAGTITLDDQRDFCHFAHPIAYRRQGGSASTWSSAGTSTYRPGGTRLQSGVVSLPWNSDNDSDKITVIFPQAFSTAPLVWATLINAGVTNAQKCKVAVYTVSSGSFVLRGYRTDNTTWSQTLAVQWVAIGPR
ncbi:MAG: hypothetical protein IPO81_09625 [Kouleothrix sp.]|nr:hypothetical protein [Kouleothrix sp.]